uniref:RZ-type domain-containing protein n=1 Tax=Acrobeloides nanus TaxID=290746 RepID=A0A914E3E7_9BILA
MCLTENLNTSFELLRKRHPFAGLNITEQERIEIVKALGGHVTKWYKCSKGHIYGIGECGQAMKLSVCPECKEEIGGSNHQLVNTSSAANEMTLGVPMRQLDSFDAVW